MAVVSDGCGSTNQQSGLMVHMTYLLYTWRDAWHGDSASMLLQALDFKQNNHFTLPHPRTPHPAFQGETRCTATPRPHFSKYSTTSKLPLYICLTSPRLATPTFAQGETRCAATLRPHFLKFSTLSRTTTSQTPTWAYPLTCRASRSWPPPIALPTSPRPCWTAWRSYRCPATLL